SLIMYITPISTLFPYTTLFRSVPITAGQARDSCVIVAGRWFVTVRSLESRRRQSQPCCLSGIGLKRSVRGPRPPVDRGRALRFGDRKSTRLNSSHQIISYAVFC